VCEAQRYRVTAHMVTIPGYAMAPSAGLRMGVFQAGTILPDDVRADYIEHLLANGMIEPFEPVG
jgi:hypothetical protein